MPLEANAVLGPYHVVGLLGEGGMGAVYRAKDTRLGRFVAIKVVTGVNLSDKERVQRFEQEARATGMLNHPNLLTIFDVGRDDSGVPYLVSELLEGETLRTRLERGPLSPRKAVDAALQMAQGLAAAHDKGIVHRDLKPDNIFLTRDGRLKILDFGIAKLTGVAGEEGQTFEMAATEPGMVLGTVGYMSPEQVRGELVDARSDLFSLGAIFYEMLTGVRAFRRNSSIETLSAILKEEPPELTEILPTIPPALDRLVRRCLEKDRDHRFQSARDLAFNLETLSTMSQGVGPATLSNVARPTHAPTLPQTAASLPPTLTSAPATPAVTPAPTRTMRAPTTARPIVKPKPRVSPVLLALLYIVSIAGAAYGAWWFANRARGEAPEPQFRRMTFRRGEVRSARFTPDGETIVYTAAWDGRPAETFVVSRNATEARPLGVADSEVLSVSKNAELAVLLRRNRVTGLGVLARVAMAGGMPRELAENVSQADWSPDGSSLAIVRVVNGKTRVEFPIGTVRYETQHFIREIRVSPDGKRLAMIEPSQGEYDLAIISDGNPETIARGWDRGATGLAWSPDGSEIWISGAPTTAPPALYAVRVDDGSMRMALRLTGSTRVFDISPRRDVLISNAQWRASLVWKTGATNVAPSATNVTPPATNAASLATNVASDATNVTAEPERDASWLDWSMLADLSPDGRTLLFNETREGGGQKSAVYLRRASEPAPVRLGDGIADALSPDGKWVVAHQGQKLVILPTGTGEARELKLSGTFEAGAAWLPDSKNVVLGGVVGQESYRLYIVDTLDEKVRPLSPPNIWNGSTRAFAVSPDGRFVAGMNERETITIYNVLGGNGVDVPNGEKGEVPIQWAPDGRAIFVHNPTALPARVYRIALDTGARELWKEFMPADPAGVYKIEPVLMTPDGNAYAYTARRTLSDLYVAESLMPAAQQ